MFDEFIGVANTTLASYSTNSSLSVNITDMITTNVLPYTDKLNDEALAAQVRFLRCFW